MPSFLYSQRLALPKPASLDLPVLIFCTVFSTGAAQSFSFVLYPHSRLSMPRLSDAALEEESLLAYGTRRTRHIVDGFVDFATQGNILEIAFGLM